MLLLNCSDPSRKRYHIGIKNKKEKTEKKKKKRKKRKRKIKFLPT